jgi:hypothetical protein
MGVCFSAQAQSFLPSSGSSADISTYPVGTQGPFPRGRWPGSEVGHSAQSGVEIKKTFNCAVHLNSVVPT